MSTAGDQIAHRLFNGENIFSGADAADIENCLRSLRKICTTGAEAQLKVATNVHLNIYMAQLLPTQEDCLRRKLLLQVLANSIVSNPETQTMAWHRHGSQLIANVSKGVISSCTEIELMILFNIYTVHDELISLDCALIFCTRCWHQIKQQKITANHTYLHFFFEDFLIHKPYRTITAMIKMAIDDRLDFLDYLKEYVANESPNGQLTKQWITFISSEFKKKSDCVLSPITQPDKQLHPFEVQQLLRLIAGLTGTELYAPYLHDDHSLFISVGSLLRCLVDATKSASSHIPKPMTKIQEVAVNSELSYQFEHSAHFELKTLLVRCIANLLYQNKKNQAYLRDINLMPTLCECSVMDARNPIIQEWVILALRNACQECAENQQTIQELKMQGVCSNDVVEELNLNMGTLRLSPK